MKSVKQKQNRRTRRKMSVRSRLAGKAAAPRLSVNRSSKHISAQVIDDTTGRTLCAVTSTSKALSGDLDGKNKTDRAAVVGAELARKAKDAGVETVVFDRGSARYHGRVKALAEAAREGGLKF
jgi:large subunit ribosomal protein L18